MNQDDLTQSLSPIANISVKIICFSPPLLISIWHNSVMEDNIGCLLTVLKYICEALTCDYHKRSKYVLMAAFVGTLVLYDIQHVF